MTDWPAGWLASRIYDDRVACWLSILPQKLEVLIMNADNMLDEIMNESYISFDVLAKLTKRGAKLALWLLNNDAMPAEVNFMLESWTSSEEYDPAVCERALEYVARQFGCDLPSVLN